jgi:hypothetical protein
MQEEQNVIRHQASPPQHFDRKIQQLQYGPPERGS